MSVFDSNVITIPCPNCGEKIDETIGRLKQDPKIPCPGCGKILAIDAEQFRQGEKSAEKSLDDFRRTLRKLGK
jgi:endogenous inhibitor of DNA gyrase (YacG/DUF329 family)